MAEGRDENVRTMKREGEGGRGREREREREREEEGKREGKSFI